MSYRLARAGPRRTRTGGVGQAGKGSYVDVGGVGGGQEGKGGGNGEKDSKDGDWCWREEGGRRGRGGANGVRRASYGGATWWCGFCEIVCGGV